MPSGIDQAYEQLEQLMVAWDKLPIKGQRHFWKEDDVLNHRLIACLTRILPISPGYKGAHIHNRLLENGQLAEALLADHKAGYLVSPEALIHGSLFSDFIEMAEHLLQEGFKDAAAVITGSVLEEHLRKLATANNVDITFVDRSGDTKPKKADVLNADLKAAGIIDSIEHKQNTAWLGIRNDAAHGKYGNYDAGQVALFIQGLTAFISKHPA